MAGDPRRVGRCIDCADLFRDPTLDEHGRCPQCGDVHRLGGPVRYEMRYVGEQACVSVFERVAVRLVDGPDPSPTCAADDPNES